MKILYIIISIICLTSCAIPEKPLTQEEARKTWESESKCLYDFNVYPASNTPMPDFGKELN